MIGRLTFKSPKSHQESKSFFSNHHHPKSSSSIIIFTKIQSYPFIAVKETRDGNEGRENELVY